MTFFLSYTIDKPWYFTYNDNRYMLLLANGALRVVGNIVTIGGHVKMIQTVQYLFKRCLLLSYNARPLFCSSTHAPGHFHHHWSSKSVRLVAQANYHTCILEHFWDHFPLDESVADLDKFCRYSPVMLSTAKHLAVLHARPFAALSVTIINEL